MSKALLLLFKSSKRFCSRGSLLEILKPAVKAQRTLITEGARILPICIRDESFASTCKTSWSSSVIMYSMDDLPNPRQRRCLTRNVRWVYHKSPSVHVTPGFKKIKLEVIFVHKRMDIRSFSDIRGVLKKYPTLFFISIT